MVINKSGLDIKLHGNFISHMSMNFTGYFVKNLSFYLLASCSNNFINQCHKV